MKQQVQGHCHCGAVRFEAKLDPADGKSRCNCSICTKSRFWKAIVGTNDFRLVSGEDSLASYRFGSGSTEHRFCSRCGVKVFGAGEAPGPVGPFVAVNVACFDDPPPEAMLAAPIVFQDGRNDAWDQVPAEVRHLQAGWRS
jgi:hypothetical protein